MMNKTIAMSSAVVALVGASWVGTIWYSSQQFEPRYQHVIKQFNQNTLSPVSFKLTSFQRGFFQSRANWELSLNTDPCQPKKILVLTGYDVIQHGFVPSLGWASIHTHVIWPDAIDSQLKQVFAQREALSIYSKVSFLGNVTTSIKSPAANWQGRLLQVNWQGLHGKIKFLDNNQRVKFDIRAPKITVNQQDSSSQLLTVSDLRYSGNQQTKPSLLPLGKTMFSIDQLQTGRTESQLSLNDIQFERKNQLNQQQIRANLNYRIGKIKLNKQTVGDFEADILLEHISEQAAQQTYQAFSQLQQQCRPSRQEMMQAFSPLLNQGFRLRLEDATLNAFGGIAQATALITMPATSSAAQQTPEALLQQLSASGRLRVSEQLLTGAIETNSALKGQPASQAETAQFVQMLTQGLLEQGYLVKTSTGYQAALAIQQGQTSINGKAIADLPLRHSARANADNVETPARNTLEESSTTN